MYNVSIVVVLSRIFIIFFFVLLIFNFTQQNTQSTKNKYQHYRLKYCFFQKE